MDYQSILDRLSYISEQGIFSRVAKADKNNNQENKDIINEIILWKINRMPVIEDSVIEEIVNLPSKISPLEASKSNKSYEIIVRLLCSKGIKLPIASTILHFYYPNIYPIIDQRAFRELYKKEYPHHQKDCDKLAKLYLNYIKDIYEYKIKNCPKISFKDIDKILYQIDKEKGNKVKY